MIRTITYLTIALFLLITNVNAQEKEFETKMKSLSIQIDEVVKNEKALLKTEIKAIEKKYNNDEITFDEAEKQKKAATELHANNIKTKIVQIETQVHELVQGKVNTKVKEVEIKESEETDVWTIIRNRSRKKRKNKHKNRRTKSNLVFALGLNNLIKDGNLNSIQDSEFKFGNSRFYEVGLNYKTRLIENSSLMYFNYGLSLRYNNLRAKSNQYFEVTGDQTNLVTHPMELSHSRLKNVQLVAPVFLEFDFSKSKSEKEKTIYRRNRSFRFGIGAFAGLNIKSKQMLEYSSNGVDTESTSKGDFNVNDFVYGTQAFIGYKSTSLYVKYDMQDLFQNSFENQKNISFGLRFDL